MFDKFRTDRFVDLMWNFFLTSMMSLEFRNNKTGLQPVSRPVERVHGAKMCSKKKNKIFKTCVPQVKTAGPWLVLSYGMKTTIIVNNTE